VEVVAEGESPLVPREDGVATENDVHRLDQFWPTLLHQHDLADAEAGSGEHPSEGDEAPILDDDEELLEVGPRRDVGSQGHRC
jgi:hypothetical protein